MSRQLIGWGVAACCFPRASGDEPLLADDIAAALKFSPRERG